MVTKNISDSSTSLITLAEELKKIISELNCLTIVRHGQTDWNKVGKFNSRTDIEISDEGRTLCQSFAPFYRELLAEQAVVVSSPLTRCIQTAGILFPETVAIKDPALVEMDFGDFEGLSPDDLQSSDQSQDLAAWRSFENDSPVREVETVTSVLGRAVRFFNSRNFDNRPVILVTHGVFSRILVSAAIGLDSLKYRTLRLDNCKCVQLHSEDGFPRLILLNSLPNSGLIE